MNLYRSDGKANVGSKKGRVRDPEHTSSAVEQVGVSASALHCFFWDGLIDRHWWCKTWWQQQSAEEEEGFRLAKSSPDLIEHAFYLLKRRLKGEHPLPQPKKTTKKTNINWMRLRWKPGNHITITWEKNNAKVWWCQWVAGLIQLLHVNVNTWKWKLVSCSSFDVKPKGFQCTAKILELASLFQ